MQYSQYDQNRHATGTLNQVLRTSLIFLEDAVKWLAGFIAHMVRQVMGK